ncbi:MAG: glycosyltransferase, partial [Selenomonadaceae bacterium]|nr:glycosyltransferase [Selenomonadaceae bacterium]
MKNNIKAYKTFGISPMLSIIVPVYNVEKYLGECLDSVISQDADDYEVVLVNDGSTDDSLVVLKEYEKKYPHCHVYNKVNGGLSSARNYGVDKATGKYVYFLDSDDKFYDDKCISFMIEELQKANLDALYFDGESFFESRKLQEQNPFYVNAYQRKNSYGDFYKGESLFKAFVEHGEYFPSSCLACYRKSFLQEHSLSFDEGYLYEDNLFTFKVMLSAKTVRHIDRKVLSRRVRAGSITQSSLTFENLKSYLRAWLQMRKFWEERKTGDASEAMGIIVDGVKSGVVLSYNSLSLSERERVAELSPYERHELKSALPASVDNGNGEYVFPYMFMKKNSAVAIYGAGKVGRAFYGQATRCDFVRIVAWVDANVASISAENLPVTTPDSLKNALFDYVLIAIEREDVANGARQTLLDLGVPNSKILWFGNYYPWNFAYDRIIYPLTEILRKLAVSGEKRLWLFMLPEHGNMGDYAIGYAAFDFLKKFFSDYSLIDITEGEWRGLAFEIKSLVQKNDILFLNGGGDFGDLWNTGKVQRNIVEAFPE